VEGHGDDAGLVLIQVDGLGEAVLRRALADGHMPFLRHLLEDEGHGIRPLYSGMASNTPNFQGELLYGLRTVVPGFGFIDRKTGREMTMNDFTDTAEIEGRIAAEGDGLLRGGSAWSDVFVGGAAESHLSASTAGVGEALRALNPLRLLALTVWHGWSVVRVVSNFLLELILALWDFVRGTLAGRQFKAELKFIGERVAVTAMMREIVTAGVCIDTERGLPVIHVNFLGYDEHAHRRGPDSAFALWTLRGIDHSIKRIWSAAHRSPRRDYQVWIYSDHGQEPVKAYRKLHGEDVREAIERAWRTIRSKDRRGASAPAGTIAAAASGSLPEAEAPRSGRSHWLRTDLEHWIPRQGGEGPRADRRSLPRDEPVVVHRGPVGFVYLPEEIAAADVEALGRAVADEARVPMVLARADAAGVGAAGAGGDPPDATEAVVWVPGEPTRRLPRDAEQVFGDHPHRSRLERDILGIVRHESSGHLTLLGWNRREAVSFKVENGAHGSAGPRETSAFLILPPEMAARVEPDRVLRALDLRDLAWRVIDPGTPHVSLREASTRPPRGGTRAGAPPAVPFRLVTYNVHGCRGMDGRYSTQRIARVIARLAPDIVCLQELDESRTRSGGVDQAHEIARLLEKEFHFHAVAELDDGRFGNAVLSSLPLRLRASGPLPRMPSRLPLTERGVLWVEVDVGGTSVQVLNTHLSIHERERRLQVHELVGDHWLANPECTGPVVLAGDFNASPDSRIVRSVETRLRSAAAGGKLRTWSSRVPMRRIDHVFGSAELEVRGVSVPRSRLSRTASDHLPLVVDFEVSRSSPTQDEVPG
jgi:endonuclease/exonuclease/phosphatase family metal-dependent hydrolase